MTTSELIHQLNNAITPARGYLELLAGTPDLPPSVRTLATEALAATERAVALLQAYQQEACPPEERPAS